MRTRMHRPQPARHAVPRGIVRPGVSAAPPVALPRSGCDLSAVSPASADRLEREADVLAREVTNGASARSRAPRGTSAAGAAAAAQPELAGAVSRSPGRPLPPETRARMEAGFGADFGAVRVHTGEHAAATASALRAAAFTSGDDVTFGAGRYRPGTAAGDLLLAHELAHVLQQRTTPGAALQRKPEDPPKNGGEFDLPWKHGQISLFETQAAGVRFLAGVSNPAEPESAVRAVIPAIGRQIAAENARIADPAYRVTTCFIIDTTQRFALWRGKPVLLLAPETATPQDAAHEMGHAVYYALQQEAKSGGKAAAAASDQRTGLGDVYARLAATKPVRLQRVTPSGAAVDEPPHPAGIWMVDPTQWSGPGARSEHPWDGADEFFASAQRAYEFDRKGLERSIARFTKTDPQVGPAGKDLLRLLGASFGKGRAPATVPPGRRAAAAEALSAADEDAPSDVDATVRPQTALYWLLHPEARPKP
jgi:Domain of unknown function (DUF4157)